MYTGLTDVITMSNSVDNLPQKEFGPSGLTLYTALAIYLTPYVPFQIFENMQQMKRIFVSVV